MTTMLKQPSPIISQYRHGYHPDLPQFTDPPVDQNHYGVPNLSNPLSIRQSRPHLSPQTAALPQSVPVPPHFARSHSRQTTPAYSLPADNGSKSKADQHLLRRKTPNGVLKNAYDGTSVEQTERTPAVKHIILPLSDQFSLNPAATPMLPQQVDSGYASFQQSPMTPAPPDPWIQPQSFGPFSATTFNHGLGPTPGSQLHLESILSQMPLGTLGPPLYNNRLGYNLMLQPMQPSFVPTASNLPGPYGSYWPNGPYQPYLPAATRDVRFLGHHTTGWMPDHSAIGFQPNHPPWDANLPQPLLSNIIPTPPPLQPSYVPPSQVPADLHYMGGHRAYNHPSASSLRHGLVNKPPHVPTPPASQKRFVPNLSRITATTRPDSNGFPAQTLPTFDESDPQSPESPRNKVFRRAVDIYIDLVKHLHKSRTAASPNRNSTTQAGRSFPRPPRPIGHDWPGPPKATRHNSTGGIVQEPQRPTPLRQHHSYVDHHGQLGSPFNQNPSDRHSHLSWDPAARVHSSGIQTSPPSTDRVRHLRREATDSLMPATTIIPRQDHLPVQDARSALQSLTTYCEESNWTWVDGLLLGGSLAYALADYQIAFDWYSKILSIDPRHVEAMSNLAATLLANNNKSDAEKYWKRAVSLRPHYFEAVEHLIGLLCSDQRNKDAIQIIEQVEQALRCTKKDSLECSSSDDSSEAEILDQIVHDYHEIETDVLSDRKDLAAVDGFGNSGYSIPSTDNGRIHTLVHARGNLLYAAGDTCGAAKAFEEAVLITIGRKFSSIDQLVRHLLDVLATEIGTPAGHAEDAPLLIPPSFALETCKLCFAPSGELPGLKDLPAGAPGIKAALATTSNSLLSLAKIFQDGMASNAPRHMPFGMNFGVREILALYYLSLSLQPSPSTANNVGILLAGLQQRVTPKMLAMLHKEILPPIPGVIPGTGVHMALAYYNYGLNLDKRHAHLYTNLGSLLKDLGQLGTAIRMYEEAVKCDQKFDIALANLANAVKDQGRIADAITYYHRAVEASPDFAEAVCGLANALNSVCGWTGRGGIADDNGARDRWHVDHNGMLKDASHLGAKSSGWVKRVVDLVDKQLAAGERWGLGAISPSLIEQIIGALTVVLPADQDKTARCNAIARQIKNWSQQRWEGQRVVRMIERIMKRLTWQWYQDTYVTPVCRPVESYTRPALPATLAVPAAPTVLPFHTFTSPMSARQIRQISQRNGLRISCSTLRAPWLSTTVSRPPPPPNPYLRVGYVSSDFNNHPLAHLMQSVFGLHNPQKVKAYCYATTASDNSIHRKQIEQEAPVFHDASTWSAEKLVKQIIEDQIHILVNLNGYTRGARNEVFAARPAPIQMSFMGFAGTLGAEWCDYLLADETAVPTDTLRPWRRNVDLEDQVHDELASSEVDNWIYGENIVYCRDTFFCCDHRQSAPDAKERRIDWEEEQRTRWAMRKELFKTLPDDAIIMGNFNQLYKIEPTTFRTWLRILDKVPKAILWLLRFPDLGESYLKKIAVAWAGPEVASRVIFTDVAPKQEHISRARVCDVFLDTPECNAHTTAADILWSGTPLLTLPRYKYKMCSRMAASILKGALPKTPEGRAAGNDLIAQDESDYEKKAVALAQNLRYHGHRQVGRLGDLRRMLWEGRWSSGLFDTRRWVRDLEEAYDIVWDRWVRGEGGDVWLDNRDRR